MTTFSDNNAQVQSVAEIMTLAEAAAYLRLSKSTLYQRKDIPRHRIPGSREVRFLRDELLSWLKSGDLPPLSSDTAVLTLPLGACPSNRPTSNGSRLLRR